MVDPTEPVDKHLSRVLHALREGEAGAADELLALVYDQLRRMAQQQLARATPGQTLQATALVHEAWLKLGLDREPQFDGRAHFFGAAARAMRNILVDQARRKAAQRRGGDLQRADLDPDLVAAEPVATDELAVDEALQRLELAHPRKVRLVELRIYAGLTMPEIAAVLDIGLATAERDWSFARAWLAAALDGGGGAA
ncbi:MAG: ECF-type sigma factor [Planctomycetes bacterium]|jgi:RNA polymerase sigma factor (TIGR02999 family)|nr:ECF-type sigma factor [Planctomycetota bacterium]